MKTPLRVDEESIRKAEARAAANLKERPYLAQPRRYGAVAVAKDAWLGCSPVTERIPVFGRDALSVAQVAALKEAIMDDENACAITDTSSDTNSDECDEEAVADDDEEEDEDEIWRGAFGRRKTSVARMLTVIDSKGRMLLRTSEWENEVKKPKRKVGSRHRQRQGPPPPLGPFPRRTRRAKK